MPELSHRIAEATRLTRSGRLTEATRLLCGLAPAGPSAHREEGVMIEGVAEAWVQTGSQAAALAHFGRTGARPAANTVCGRGDEPHVPAAGHARDRVAPASGAAGSTGGARFLSCSFTLAPAAPDAEAASGREGSVAAGRFGGLAGLGAGSTVDARRGTAGLALPGSAFPRMTMPGLPLSGAAQGATRPYRLYVPASYDGRPAPLVVMLHGCTQSATDFALGTRMNEAAEAQGCLVVWPEQVASANASRCWRWFEASEQRRGEGEPALVAGITRQVMAEYAVDPARVYVAGLSAGGAAAAVLGARYPELYAAIGVHSGLPCGAARDTASAFAAMRSPGPGRAGSVGSEVLPAIVFHGDADATVHPGNADAVIAQAGGAQAGGGQGGTAGAWTRRAEQGRVPGGRAYDRVRHVAPDGITMLEQWTVHGAGHAWSGGSTAGSYTDPQGPDATGEMLRFFLEHPRRG